MARQDTRRAGANPAKRRAANPAERKRAGAATLTVADLAADVLADGEREGFAANTLRGYRSSLRLHLLPRFGERPIASIESDDLADLVADLRAKGLTENGVLDAIKPLRKALELAQSRDLIDSNPYDALDAGSRPQPLREEHRILTAEEIGALAQAADEPTGIAIGLALFCGLRNAEARALRVSDLDPDGPAVIVTRRGPRGKVSPAKPSAPERRRADGLGDAFGFLGALRDHLAARDLAPDAPLIRSPTGRHFDRGNFSRRYGLVVARAGLAAPDEPPLTFEQLRNNFAALAARLGTNPIELLRQLGKSHTASLQPHLHYFELPPVDNDERARLEAAARQLAAGEEAP